MVGFNHNTLDAVCIIAVDLHSIMVGFNPGRVSIAARIRDVFTFHYGRIQSGTKIYTDRWMVEFTFHYGRIQSAHGAADVPSSNIFTFHYGRIQSL